MFRMTSIFNRVSKAALRVALAAVLMLASSFFMRAQEHSLRIFYKIDDATVFENYLSNSQEFARLDAAVREGASKGFEIVTFSSPEGNFEYNSRLATHRAESLRKWLVAKYPQLNGKVSIAPSGESWADLRAKVEADSRLSSGVRSRVLGIIDSNKAPDAKEAELKAQPEYRALYANYFRTLRFAEIRFPGVQGDGSSINNGGQGAGQAEAPGAGSANAATGANGAATSPHADVIFSLRSTVIDVNSYSNRAVLSAVASMLEGKSIDEVNTISIVSTASPEGPLSLNNRLSAQRGEALRDYIVSNFPELEEKISVRSAGEAWDDFKAAVENDPALSDASRDRILSVILSSDGFDAKEAKLRSLPEWNHLMEDIFPVLRYARISVDQAETEPNRPEEVSILKPDVSNSNLEIEVSDDPVHVQDTTLTLVDTAVHVPAIPVSDTVSYFRPKKTIVALKTNLLYDAVTALNFEVEVPIGKRWSVVAEDLFPWWETGNKYCFQLWEIGLEGRYWLKPWDVNGTQKLRGLFGGVYLKSGKYDFQYDKSTNYQGEFWTTGVTAGFSKPIGRSKKLNLEMSLSVGYLRSPYRHYMPADDYSKLFRDPFKTGTVNYFGPTEAKISLVVPINVPRKMEVSHE